jgi:hypothetical protein
MCGEVSKIMAIRGSEKPELPLGGAAGLGPSLPVEQ